MSTSRTRFQRVDRRGIQLTPTLVIGGERDRAYSCELLQETAQRIPNGRFVLYEGRGPGGTTCDRRRFAREVIAFLKAEQPAPR